MIGKVLAFISRKKQVFKEFLEYQNYMNPGIYQWDNTLRFIMKTNPNAERGTYHTFYNYYGKKERFFLWLARHTFFRDKIVVNGNGAVKTHFVGEVYRPFRSTNNYRDKKLFNFAEGKVLSIFSRDIDYRRTLDIHKKFQIFFPMPKILWKNQQNREICEELVEFVPIEMWTEDDYEFVMNDMLTRSLRYLQKESKRKLRDVTPRMTFLALENKQEIRFIYKMVTPHLLRESHPCIELHGDLWRSNTFLIKDRNLRKVVYIDWEFSEELPFFYDFFTFIWLDGYVNQEDFYFKRYLAGEYDSELQKMYSFFGLTYNPAYRIDYFHIYFLYFYSYRLFDLPKYERMSFIKRYKQFVEMAISGND